MSRRACWWGVAALAVLALLSLLRMTLREPTVEPSPAPTAPVARMASPRHTAFPPEDPSPALAVVAGHTAGLTNAADVYRQAFGLYDALSGDEKAILSDWLTNVDEAVALELCEKIRPICGLMHEATGMTNCDWGLRQMTFTTPLSHLSPARNLARVGIWSATHCRKSAAPGAIDDLVVTVQLGRQIDDCATIGNLVDIAIEKHALACIASNLEWFAGVDAQRLIDLFNDPAVAELPSRAMQTDADVVERLAGEIAVMTPAQAEERLSQLADGLKDVEVKMDRSTGLASLKEISALERELATVLVSGSGEELDAWTQHSKELIESNQIAQVLLPSYDAYINKVQQALVSRAMVVAALAIKQTGSVDLAAHLDPATGEPFVYASRPDGFELQSQFKVKDRQLTMFFPNPEPKRNP